MQVSTLVCCIMLTIALSPVATHASWQSYVDDNLVGTKTVSQAAIIGHDGSVPGQQVQVSRNKGEHLLTLFKTQSFGSFKINNQEYQTLKADDRSVYGKAGQNGCATVKTAQAVLIGVYKNGQQPGAVENTVEKLADYLIDQGY